MGNGAKETDWADYGAAEGKDEVIESSGVVEELPPLEEPPEDLLPEDDLVEDLPDDERIPDVISDNISEEK